VGHSQAMSDPLVFLSVSPISGAANAAAKWLAAELRRSGVEPWLEEEEPAGSDWAEHTRHALESSDAYVLFVTPDPSPGERREWSEALKQSWEHPEKRVIPVVLADDEIPGALGDRQAVRVDPETGEGLEEVVELVSRRAPVEVLRSKEATRRLSDRIAEIRVTAMERAERGKGPVG